MIYIGLDPGSSSGAYGIINHDEDFIACGDILSVDGRVDAIWLYEKIMSWVNVYDTAMIAVESVHSMPKQGIASTAKFMRAAGVIEAVAALTRYPYILVTPQAWKKYHGLIGSAKSASLETARLHWEDADLRLVKHHGRADALLMALWLKRKNHG
jgi:hypothetical protein